MLKRFKGLILKVTIGANVATIIVMLMCAYATYINPLHHPVLSCFTLLFPIFLVLNCCFLVVWLLFRAKCCLLPLAGFLLCIGSIRNYCPINWPSKPPRGCIKVLSYNSFGFWLDSLNEEGKSVGADYLIKSNADIILLQEAGNEATNHIIDSCLAVYPYHAHQAISAGGTHLACYSRFPIVSVERVPYESSSNGSFAYVMLVHGDSVLVINNHLESNKLQPGDKTAYKEMIEEPDEQTLSTGSRILFGKLGHASAIRSQQVKAINDYIAHSGYKSVISCGDCNDSPLSYTVRQLSKYLNNAFVHSGNGLGLSYNQKGFLVRIDNIFYSGDWKSYGTQVDKTIGISDHYPIFTYLKKKEK
jgi:endonuclease/exonuclease/phosphatase (EEP) superfamily protein YafD